MSACTGHTVEPAEQINSFINSYVLLHPENIMFCPRCGSDNPEKAKFCIECGFDLHEVRSILQKQQEPGKPGGENGGSPAHAARPAVPVKKEDPRKQFIRATTPLPDSPEDTLSQNNVPVRSVPGQNGDEEPVSPQQSVPGLSPQMPEPAHALIKPEPIPAVPKPELIRSPSLAAALSVIPGLGQVYNGSLVRGILLFILTLFGLLLFVLPGVCIWIYCIYDAYHTAGRINRGEIPFVSKKKPGISFLY